jgi:hypothetical protein
LGFGIIARHPSDPWEGYLINQPDRPDALPFSCHAAQSGTTFFITINAAFSNKNLTQIILIHVKWIR